MKYHCRSCGLQSVMEVLDLGPQPPSNRFLNSQEESYEECPTRLGSCFHCGLVQLIAPRSAESVRSEHTWLVYNEPERHLDDLTQKVCREVNLEKGDARVLGLTYKDDSTLERLLRCGFAQGYRLSQREDLGIGSPLASLETVQAVLTAEKAQNIVDLHGRADVVVVRHLLEHAHAPLNLVRACASLTKPSGLMVFEVPDCRKVFLGGDHCFIWEEHITYFTQTTLEGFFGHAGFGDVQTFGYPYALEDSLIALVRNTGENSSEPRMDQREVNQVLEFAAKTKTRGERIRRFLAGLCQRGQKVAVFGAGHLTLKFINYYSLTPYLSFVVDDNPNKQGRFMPGSSLPILSSAALQSEKIDLCLLGLSPESEARVLVAQRDYRQRGGRFMSVFSGSENSIDAGC